MRKEMSAIVEKLFFRHYLLVSLLGSIWFALLEFGPGMQKLEKMKGKKAMPKKTQTNCKKFRNHTGIHVFCVYASSLEIKQLISAT